MPLRLQRPSPHIILFCFPQGGALLSIWLHNVIALQKYDDRVTRGQISSPTDAIAIAKFLNSVIKERTAAAGAKSSEIIKERVLSLSLGAQITHY
jgi:hypothetical protein